MGDSVNLDRLEQLLNRPRTDRKRELVRAVMVQPIGIADRVQRIEMIDLLPEEPPAPRPLKPRPPLDRSSPPAKGPRTAPPPSPPPLVDPDLSEAQRVERYRRHLGQVPGRAGVVTYLFRHYVPLSLWANETGAIDQGWFPFTLKLGQEAEVFLRRTLWSDLLPVVRSQFSEVLAKAWATLTKEKYNLLAAADALVRGLEELPPLPAAGRIPLGFLDPVLGPFALFLTDGGRSDDLVQAWDQAALFLGRAEKSRHLVREALLLLVGDRPGRTSLATVIRACLSLRTRRLVDLGELVPGGPAEYFPKDSFEASPKVLAEVQRAVDQGVNQAEALGRELKEVRKVRWFVPEENLLGTFVGTFDPQVPGGWCLAYLDKMLLASGPLVTSLKSTHLTSVMARLEELRDQLRGPEIRRDPEIPAAVARVSTNLGKNLASLVRARCRTIDPQVQDPLTDPPPHPLENEAKVLESPEEWGGLTVAEALVQTARVALLAGRFLGEGSIDIFLAKEPDLENRLREVQSRLDRIAPPEVAAKARMN